MGGTIGLLDAPGSPEGRANQRYLPLASLRLQRPPRMLCEVDVGGVVFENDIVDVKTGSFRQPHACVSDEGDKPSGLIVLHPTVSLYAPDVLKWYRLASLVVLKVRQIDTRESVAAVEAVLLDAQVDDRANGREVAFHRVRR